MNHLLWIVFIFITSYIIPFGYAQELTHACPMNFTLLDEIKDLVTDVKGSTNITYQCTDYLQTLHFMLVDYTARSGYFLVPDNAAEACWTAFNAKLSNLGVEVNVSSLCNLTVNSISLSSQPCNNITSVKQLQELVPSSELSVVSQVCANASSQKLSVCTACTAEVLKVSVNYITTTSTNDQSINTCQDILSLYAASSAPNSSRADVASCLFNILQPSTESTSSHLKYIYVSVGAAVGFFIVLALLVFFYMRFRRKQASKNNKIAMVGKERMGKSNCNLVWFSINEIKEATGNFSRDSIIGSGKFGNVFKGKLPDGTEIAVKRFKNSSLAGDDEFFHEVEMISSAKHRNLVPLIGCCVNQTEREGYQRIIVFEYMPNGSLYDHLFVKKTALDWPRRQNIAIGIVRGLVYLHQEVQPAIIHRDIKSSNILLDANWNARVADFGLAKFRPEGATHVTTRVAGTQGYVAPEYVLYGQLTEKSDVYSFGIVLLELLTGMKTLHFGPDSEQPILITDWAWPLVKQGRTMDVIDPKMENLGLPEVVERFVVVALLCAHPQVPLRPTLYEVLKIMENDQPLPALLDRPVPYNTGFTSTKSSVDVSSGSTFYSFSSGKACL